MVDEAYHLETEIVPIEAGITYKKNRLAELKKQIGLASTVRADQPDQMSGTKGICASLGPRENKTTIKNMLKVFRLLKQNVFLGLCSVPLEVLKTVAKEDYEALVETTRMGSRPVKLYRTSEAAQQQAA